MTRIVVGEAERVGAWVMAQNDAVWLPGQGQGFGVEGDDGELIAGVVFDNYNGASIQIHVAALPGVNWVSKQLLSLTFSYPFLQLNVQKLIGLVGSTNKEARRFDEHLGFRIEATLKDAYPGGDLLIYSMTRGQCRWIPHHQRNLNGQEIFSPAAGLRSPCEGAGGSQQGGGELDNQPQSG
jgi:RimJ/RimL family protein N-acetyltransferase